MFDSEKFLKEAQAGLVTVEFMNIRDGGKRVMACTLNNDTAKSFGQEIPAVIEKQTKGNDQFVVWAVDKNAWRSFIANTVVSWYKGEPKQPEQSFIDAQAKLTDLNWDGQTSNTQHQE